jgi:hypothetical protein
VTSTGERADAWGGKRTRGTQWHYPSTDNAVNIPGVLELDGGPWGATTLRVRGTTPKGNGTTKEVAALYRLGKLQRVGGVLAEYQRLAARLNGWETGRYFMPGKPEDWRSQCKYPPEEPAPCPFCSPAKPMD